MNEMHWTPEELDVIGGAEEVELASYRPGGSLRPKVTMWLVRVGSELFVRSAGGPERSWYRHARSSERGRLLARGIERDVVFAVAPPGVHDAIDVAYHAKYDRYGPRIVGSVVGPAAHDVTVRLVPGGSDAHQ